MKPWLRAFLRWPEDDRRVESDLTHPRAPSQWLLDVLGSGGPVAGMDVTPSTAIAYSAVYSAITILSQDVAILPLILYRKTGLDGEGREPATDHPLYAVLHDAPNPEQTAITFRETMMGQLLSRGNAYAEIERNVDGSPRYLWPLPADRVVVQRDKYKGAPTYVVDARVALPADKVFHLLAFGNGAVGYSPLHLARTAIGLGMASEANAASLFGSGSIPGGVLQSTKAIRPEAAERLRRDWEALHGGAKRAGRIAVLEDGLTYNPISVTPADAQFLESRKFQVEEIARFFRLPPHKLGLLDRATFSNIEQQSREYLQHSLQIWLGRWEQEIARKLLPNDPELFAEHKTEGFLKGDTLARYQAYAIGRTAGFLSINDIRRYENLEPVEGGDDYGAPLNSNTTAGASATSPGPNPPPPPNGPQPPPPQEEVVQ